MIKLMDISILDSKQKYHHYMHSFMLSICAYDRITCNTQTHTQTSTTSIPKSYWYRFHSRLELLERDTPTTPHQPEDFEAHSAPQVYMDDVIHENI